MQIIPALRLRDGAAVGRLAGAAAPALLAERAPASWARWVEGQGASGLHVVDENGEDAGALGRLLDLLDVIMAVSIPVQVSAGLRRPDEIGQILSRGAARAVIDVDRLGLPSVRELVGIFGARLVPSLAAPSPELIGALAGAGAERWLWRAGGPADDVARLRDLPLPALLARDLSLDEIREVAGSPGLEAIVLENALWMQRFTVPEARLAAGEF